MDAPIYVVVSADDLNRKYRDRALKDDPGRLPNPIVWETNVNGATREAAQKLAGDRERGGYQGCRIGRVVFEDVDGRPL